ncbi:MAG: hypothetical protein CVV05_05380 [Gammaproteobacteria bacterium HGW-Gammaproteobacteria-1]|jgi:hypothetical protein|nr:MAG: hypothetical protein CVV05_05380 [Gammaproteobacteria bacterium HGW-Gammaproteobacteria-1]
MKAFALIIALFTLAFFVGVCNAKDGVITKIELEDGISLVFEEIPYDRDTDIPTDCGDGYICLVNNRPLWGADGKLPVTKLGKAIVKIDAAEIQLDTSGMYDPLISADRKSQYEVTHYYGEIWKVRASFSDGAGAYYAEWLVTRAGSIRILIGDSELLHDAFESIFGER